MSSNTNPWILFDSWQLEDYLKFREHDDKLYDEIEAELERRKVAKWKQIVITSMHDDM
jgi:hypothetical protein